MKIYKAPYYTETQLNELDESQVHFPFSDKDAEYNGLYHQYELTNAYFEERGRNLDEETKELYGNSPDRVKHFLSDLRQKVYLFIYNHNKSSRPLLNYMIACRGLRTFPSKYEYRQAFLEAMFLEGCYLLDNGDISSLAGVDFDTMQNLSADVMRNQNRDFHKEVIGALTQLGLTYYGRYRFPIMGEMGVDW